MAVLGQLLRADACRLLGGPKTLPKKRRRDFQRGKVYAWERAHVHKGLTGPALSLAECEALVHLVFREHERPNPKDRSWRPPLVTDGRGRRHACGSREVIKLPRWSRHPTVVLHECAHGMSDDGHGPEFVRTYITLLVRYAGSEARSLNESAAKAGIKIAGSEAGKAAQRGR